MAPPRKYAPGTRGKPFAPGNPGKPKGARNRATRLLEALLGDSAEAVAIAVISAAKGGDTAAARLVLERVLPARKDSPVTIKLPADVSAAGLVAAGRAVLKSVATGQLTPSEGDAMMGLLERQRRIIDTANLEGRLAALERRLEHEES